MNPPYSEEERVCPLACKKKTCAKRGYHCEVYKPGCYQFIQKAAQQRKRGVKTVCLVASRTDNSWWHEFVWDRYNWRWRTGVTVQFLKGRLKFKGQKDSAPFPSAIIVFTP